MDSAVDLFKGKALIWYWSICPLVSSWNDLSIKLKREFQPFDYDILLWEEIKRRTQGKDETIGVYVAVTENLFKRLGAPVSETAKLAI